MRLRLMGFAVALLLSFAARAEDFSMTGAEYIRNVRKYTGLDIESYPCAKVKNDAILECFYQSADIGVQINEFFQYNGDEDSNQVYFLIGICHREPCSVADYIRIFMKSSPKLSKYVRGFSEYESWEDLAGQTTGGNVPKNGEEKEVKRENDELLVAIIARGSTKTLITIRIKYHN